MCCRFTPPACAQYSCASLNKLWKFKFTFFPACESPSEQDLTSQTKRLLCSLSLCCWLRVSQSAPEHYTLEPPFSLISFKYLFVFLTSESFSASWSAELKPRSGSQESAARKWPRVNKNKREFQRSVWGFEITIMTRNLQELENIGKVCFTEEIW